MSKRSYSDKEKGAALAILDANDGNISRTSEMLKIPRKTISEWARDRFLSSEVADIRQDKKKELGDELEEIAYSIAGVMPHFAKSPFNKINELSTALGTVIDKMLLLRGKPTSINESRGENRQWAEQQLAELMKEFNLNRADAIELAKQHAPTVAEWVM